MEALARLGNYKVLRRIAVGGMAEVFLAVHEGLEGFEKPVALKRILPHLVSEPQFVKMFLDEARIAARLSHPNIVQIFDLGVQDGHHFLAMEYVFGESLARLTERLFQAGEKLPLNAALFVGTNLCLALHHAHTWKSGGAAQPIVHRDVSPHNVLLSFDGAVKLSDFGIAKVKGAGGNTTLGMIKGKVGYMAPEQILGEPVDARTDLFALGIILYELVTGEAPFKGNSMRAIFDAVTDTNPPAPSSIADVPKELDALVMKSLEKAPAKRFQSAREMLVAIEAVQTARGLVTNPLSFGAIVEQSFGNRAPHAEAQSVVDQILAYLDARTEPNLSDKPTASGQDLEATLVKARAK